MRLAPTLAVAAAFGLALTGTAFAQGVDSGLKRVNPLAARGTGAGCRVSGRGTFPHPAAVALSRVSGGGPIQLHMPGTHNGHHRPHHAAGAQAQARRQGRARAGTSAQARPGADSRTQRQSVRRRCQSGQWCSPAQPHPLPRTAPAARSPAMKISPSVASSCSPRMHPIPPRAPWARSFLASDLNAAMTGLNARVELEAFGGNKGDKGSMRGGCRSSAPWPSVRC